ncbi:MAG: sigma-54 dependent transcriptional regulator [Chlamydiae bacterium]|nr:sigma-54 dependent transcriptional regulator [Chlamydiota bacterium]
MKKIVAESSVMKKLLEDLGKIAQTNASVFITGESGTGKEVVANTIHFQSKRCNDSFIKVNCAAIPESLLESEFFGHEKGSFTGAIQKRIGRFELADKGTLLLDEISEIPLSLQPKLLRAIQEQQFERVGGASSVNVDIRFIATSNRNMKEAIEQKCFREDLFYRLSVVLLHIPPLRERVEDILPLTGHFLDQFCTDHQRKLKSLSDGSKEKLLHYSWPGNIRELANLMERVVIMNRDEIIYPHQLNLEGSSSKNPLLNLQAIRGLKEVEKEHILEVLSSCQYNKSKAAKILKISERTLRNKLLRYSLNKSR